MTEVASVHCIECSASHQAVIQVVEGGGAFVVTSWLEPHLGETALAKLVDLSAKMFADQVAKGHLDMAAEAAEKALELRDPEDDGDPPE